MCFVPERKFEPVPNPKLVVDCTKIVLDDVLGVPDAGRDLAVLKSLGNERDELLLSFVERTVPIQPATYGGMLACASFEKPLSALPVKYPPLPFGHCVPLHVQTPVTT